MNGIFGSGHARVFFKVVIVLGILEKSPRMGDSFPVNLGVYVCRFGVNGLLRGCFSSILLVLLFIV